MQGCKSISIPPSLSKRCLEILYKSTKEQIHTRFRKVSSHERTERNAIPVIVSDVEGADGSRFMNYTSHSETIPSQAAGLFLLIAPGKYMTYEREVERVRASPQVIFQPTSGK